MSKIFITRKIPDAGPKALEAAGYQVIVSPKDGVLTKEELISVLKEHNPDAVLCLLTDKIDVDVFNAAQNAVIFANYAVGVDNVDLKEAQARNVVITNTPGVLTDSVAEHTVALIFAIAKRIAEADQFMRGGKYVGWAPMLLLGSDLKGKTLGILGGGRIGSRVLEIMGKGVGMRCVYYDIKRSEELEKATGAEFRATVEEVLRESDVVSIHVPLLDSTQHLVNKERLHLMKKTAYLINTSRGPVVDEIELVFALRTGIIRGAALDVFENEPRLTPGLASLENVILTPHTASATEETRTKMAEMAAQNIIEVLKGQTPPNVVKPT